MKTLDIQAPQISQKRNSENLLSFMIAKNFVKSIDMKSTDSNCSAFLCFDFTKLFAIMTESKFSQFLFCEICAWVSVVCNLLLHSSRSRKSTSLYFWIYMSEDLGLKWPFHGGKDIGLYLAARRTLQKVGLLLWIGAKISKGICQITNCFFGNWSRLAPDICQLQKIGR